MVKIVQKESTHLVAGQNSRDSDTNVTYVVNVLPNSGLEPGFSDFDIPYKNGPIDFCPKLLCFWFWSNLCSATAQRPFAMIVKTK